MTIQPAALVANATSNASNRAELAAMLRGAGLDLLEAVGVPLRGDAPFDPGQAVWSDPVSLVGFTGGTMAGTLIVSAPWPLMARTSPISDHRPEGLADWSRELSNMMLGGLKIELLRRGLELQMGLPASVVSTDMRIATSSRDPIGHRFDCGGQDLLAALDWLVAPGVVLPTGTVPKAELALGHEFLLL